ncbi:MAG: hypothetical protein ACI8ZB_002990, partial [Desulforhopalus sp.]
MKGVEKSLIDGCFQFRLNSKSAFISILIDAVAYCTRLTWFFGE